MNSVPTDLAQLQQLLWLHLSGTPDSWTLAWGAFKSLVSAVALGLILPVATVTVVFLALVLLYQPRVPRGALWIPAFGIFGGTPKLYLVSRPPSLCGCLLRTIRRSTSPRRRRAPRRTS